jgi:hypothetical protein
MKIIFLDIDGVLNNPGTYTNRDKLVVDLGCGGLKYRQENCFEPELVSNLNEIIKQTGAYIVLSSSWRYGLNSHGEIKALLNKIFGIKGNILGKTPECIVWKTRAEEIQAWLDRSLPYYQDLFGLDGDEPLENFIILDDDRHFGNLQNNLIKIDGSKGLTKDDANKTIEMLNSQSEPGI